MKDYEPHLGFNSLMDLASTYTDAGHTNMLSQLAWDFVEPDGRTLLGARRAPAAKRNHHAFEGGWCYHILEMWSLWSTLKENPVIGRPHPDLNDERVFKAILYHDLHKIHRTYRLLSLDPWITEYANEDPTERMMTWSTKSLWLLNKYKIELDPVQYNALLWSEGGWSEHARKLKGGSVLAKVAYLLDELSGNVIGRIEQDTYVY